MARSQVQGTVDNPKETVKSFTVWMKLAGVPPDVMERVNKQPWAKTENMSQIRVYMSKADVPKKYVDLFNTHVLCLVKKKNSPAWKDCMVELFKDVNLPAEVGEKIKKIGPDTLPKDHGIRKKLLLDAGLDPEMVNNVHPFLDWAEDLQL